MTEMTFPAPTGPAAAASHQPLPQPPGAAGSIVTISASYGAGGSVIGPRVAAELCVPFIDRAIPTRVAEELHVSTADALAHDEETRRGVGWFLAALARAGQALDTGSTSGLEQMDEARFRRAAEDAVELACASGAVLLGRAGAVILADNPLALHVRLDGPVAGRVAQGAAIEHVDATTAARRQRASDRAREGYVRDMYEVDATDPRHYHLVLNSIALGLDACVDAIVAASRAFHRPPTAR